MSNSNFRSSAADSLPPLPAPVLIYSVGHANRQADALLALLQSVGVTAVVDVRAQPGSRRHPQFNSERLRAYLDEAGITYHWAGRHLGGLRHPRPDSPHTALAPAGLRGFADHMETMAFRRAVGQLIHLASRMTCVILCAEKDPAQCHRALIADYLAWQGVRVVHLLEPGHLLPHRCDPRARPDGERLVYDGASQRLFDWH